MVVVIDRRPSYGTTEASAARVCETTPGTLCALNPRIALRLCGLLAPALFVDAMATAGRGGCPRPVIATKRTYLPIQVATVSGVQTSRPV